MNQSVIFNDSLKFAEGSSDIVFMAQYQGTNIPCHISLVQLNKLTKQNVKTQATAIDIAESFRFDIEEHFEEKIDAEDMDENGVVHY